ncbi:hypothetical protein [Streptomyces sp. NP160]|uniref:hypothetical protein n=1 Tax=Streptomyces sp. NP160 TaxID=2586637 RepID=UPI0015D654CF|nr:hypothetical protein [Streptomyces sp. NP160]
MPATATAPARVQALLGRPRRRGHVEVSGLPGAGILLLVLALLVLTMASPLDRAGRSAHAAPQLIASGVAAHTHANLATLAQAPHASASTAPSSTSTSAQDVPATPALGQDAPSGHNGDHHHHHVDLDPVGAGALHSAGAAAFALTPARHLSVLLVAAVTLTYPD